MELFIDGVEQALIDQLRAVHRLTVALHRAETAANFYDEALDTILAVLKVDRAALLLFDSEGVMRFKAWRGLSPDYRTAAEGHSPWTAGQRDAVAVLVPDVEADPDLTALLPVLRAEGIAAAAFIPLETRAGVIGKFMLYYSGPQEFPPIQVAMAEILAGHVGLAVERQRAHEELRHAATRAASLATVTSALGRAVGLGEVADVVLGVALRELGAHTGSMCMIDGDELYVAAAAGYAGEVLAHWDRFPLGADLPASEAVRTGRAVFLSDADERLTRYPIFAGTPLVGDQAYAIVPLGAEIPLGALVIGFAEPRRFTGEDEAFLVALAGQCASALGRAHLYEEREQARREAEESRSRLAFLAEASATLTASLDYPVTLARLAELAVPRLGQVCAVHLLEEGGVQLVGLAHADPDRAAQLRRLAETDAVTLRNPVGVGAVLRTGTRALYPQITDDLLAAAARDPEHLAQLRDLQLGPTLIVPLQARGRTIGALSLSGVPGDQLDEDTVALAEQLAERAAVAIENARLFTARTAAARSLQASLLPPDLPVIDGLDLAARYVAGSAGLEIGGDFYDLFPLYGNRYLLVLGDVCGRGVQAAATALLIRHVLHSAAVNLRDPATILAHLNDVMLRRESPTEETGEEPRFATAALAVVHPRPDRTVAVTLALAGHPLPLLREADGTTGPVGTPGSVLGITETADFHNHTILLRPGQALVTYTDGVTERRNGRDLFGEDRLAATVAAAPRDAAGIAAAIETAVAGFAPDELSDDLAVLVLRSRPPA